ncbi:PIN domain-containing protein [bacterium]|nr:PIN domain-containing protein [candidate division CSSED10-310 bacterium]
MTTKHCDVDLSRKIIVDTSVWIDYFLDRQTPQALCLSYLVDNDADILIPDLILCEILQGCRTKREISRVDSILSNFEIVTIGGADLARISAGNYRHLRNRGITVRSTIDCLIATYTIEMGCVLLHNDRDYSVFEEFLELQILA